MGSIANSLRERRRQMLRDDILDAAWKLLAEKGYAAMSMDDLAAHVGISKPTLYSSFPTKEDIVVSALVREIGRLRTILEAELGGDTPLQRLTQVLRTIVQLHADSGVISPSPRLMSPELFHLLCARQEATEAIRQLDVALTAL